DDPWTHWLERVGTLCAPQRAIAFLPGPLADIVTDGPSEDAIQRLIARDVLRLSAEHGDKFAFVLEFVAGVGRFQDLVAVGAECAIGAIADVGPRRERRLCAANLGHFD